MTSKPVVGMTERPTTIHDFAGFDPLLYEIEYPVLGHPELAQLTFNVLKQAGWSPSRNIVRGLDHGAWIPLMHMFPNGEVPTFQVSLPEDLNADDAWALGEALAPLSEEGVLIVGSGSTTHNLHELHFNCDSEAMPYVVEFSRWLRRVIASGDVDRLRRTLELAPHAQRAHPTSEHFWPLLVAAGATGLALNAAIFEGGVTHGVLSMDTYLFGHSSRGKDSIA